MPIDYDTVGQFYETLSANLSAFVARVGEKEAFCGDRNLQLSRKEIDFQGCDPVFCSKTALAAFEAIVTQGEGAAEENPDSHYCRFLAIRKELAQLKAANPAFEPAHPAAVNPVLRRPVRAGVRVWLEDEQAAATVDIANSAYMLMLRLIAHSYLIPRPHPSQGPVCRSRTGIDARHGAARRAGSAPAGRAIESGLQRRHVVHRAARCRATSRRASAPGSFSSSGCASSRRARRRWRRTVLRAWRNRSRS